MDQKNLENYVRGHFGTSLYDFIKTKVEVESLYDYEVAAFLNVNPAVIGILRKRFRLKKPNGFSRRFENKYGQGAVDRFKKMSEDSAYSLSDVARYFGFSREYARQVYIKIYGQSYSKKRRSQWGIERLRKSLSAGQG